MEPKAFRVYFSECTERDVQLEGKMTFDGQQKS